MNDVVDRQEVMRVAEFLDQSQFLVNCLAQFDVNIAGKTCCNTSPCQIRKMPLRRLAWRNRFVGILVFQFIERERDAIRKSHGFLDRLGQVAKQPRHLIAGLHVPLGIGL